MHRGGERGTARPEVLNSLLQSTERVVQEIDSVEYGLTDIQVLGGNPPQCQLSSGIKLHCSGSGGASGESAFHVSIHGLVSSKPNETPR